MYTSSGTVQLTSNDPRKLSEVQEAFSVVFPYLKIEFFKNGTFRKERYRNHLLLNKELLLREAGKAKPPKPVFEISALMTVAELERTFQENYGLSVQVFRKSGNIWLETSMTESWTLGQQNAHGREITAPLQS
ncbi:MAG: hypothetical protein ACKO6K_10505 [Chitinophagaceae bacterium]